jgi:hypothetical protein
LILYAETENRPAIFINNEEDGVTSYPDYEELTAFELIG